MSQAGPLQEKTSGPSPPNVFETDSGNASAIGGTIEILGGTGIATSASGNIITITNTETSPTVTQHALLIGGPGNTITSLLLTNGQLAIGNTGNDPTAATLTAGSGISIANAAGAITISSTVLPSVVSWDRTFALMGA